MKFTARLQLLAILGLATIALHSCTTPSKSGGGPDSGASLKGREGNDYKAAYQAFVSAQYDSAIAKLTAFEKKYPKSTQLSQVRNLRGMCFLLTRRPQAAIQDFKKAHQSSNQSSFRQYVLYNLASAEYESGAIDAAKVTLSQIQMDYIDRETQVKVHSLKSRVLLKANQFGEAAKEILELSLVLDETQPRNLFITQLDQALQGMSDADTLSNLYDSYANSPLADQVLFRLTQAEVQQGRIGPGEAHIQTFVERFPQSPKMNDVLDLQRTMRSQAQVSGLSVGALLPMSGKFAKYGQKSLQGIQLALGIFNPDQQDSRITLVVEDAGETPEQAVRALNNLVFNHKVVGVIGPLTSKGIDQVAQRAQELGVPLISLAQQVPTSGNTANMDFFVPSALTAQVQAAEMARYAIEKLGLKKFAILHPKDKFGQQYSNAFWDAVENMGGKIVGVEGYVPNETDFRQPIDRMSGLYYQDARLREAQELTKIREEQQIKKKTRKNEKMFDLGPIIDYEAVYIPDEPKVIGQVLPTFAFRDVRGVKYLGSATWHSPELISRAQAFAEGSYFVDAWVPESGDPNIQRFLARYKSTFGSDPGMMEALAFDAAEIIQSVLARFPVNSRSELRDKIRGIQNHAGVTGRITFRDGQLGRNLAVLTVRNGLMSQVQ
ncbi:MAG: penicillin-binding protein activator [Bdellovibrionales bacterium]|nr:penicillin-binding protein activator [Bdellovibrionales bacterium]